MKVPKLARYNGTVSKDYNFVNENIYEFPIDLFTLIKKFKWGLITYEKLALKNKCTINDICECLGTDGYSIYNGNNFTIAYNNKIHSKGRINFTLAHEIGHIVLNHHKDFDVTEILEDNFSKAEYKILENEANCFARNILAPAPLVNKLDYFDMIFDVPDCFNITLPPTTTRISFLKNDLYYLSEEQIKQFELKYKRYKRCNTCKARYLGETFKYCPLCGSKKIVLGDVFSMRKYKGIESLSECPICENVDFSSSDKYCIICGNLLHNYCSNIDCGIELPLNARFCNTCGSKSSYYESEILKNWKQSSYEDMTSFDDLPF